MKKRLSFINLAKAVCLLIFSVASINLWGQTNSKGTGYLSFLTQQYIGAQQSPTDREIEDAIDRAVHGLKRWDEAWQEAKDPGSVLGSIPMRGLNWVNDQVANIHPVFTIMNNGKKEFYDLRASRGIVAQQEAKFEKAEQIRSLGMGIGTICKSDLDCIKKGTEKVLNDPKIRVQLDKMKNGESLFNDAMLQEIIIATAANSDAQQGTNYGSIEELINQYNSSIVNQLSSIDNENRRQSRNIAKLVQLEKEQAIALSEIQATIDANQEEINKKLDQGFGETKILLEQNLLLSTVILENTEIINEKIDDIGKDIDAIKLRQLIQLYNDETSLERKLQFLKSEKGMEICQGDSTKWKSTIKNIEVLRQKEKIVNLTKAIKEWGKVGEEAINILCPDCPKEILEVVSVSMTASDILGSVITGNWSQALLSGLSLFKKPKPGPEMQMLKQISDQLNILESNMNDRFKEVHEHMFAMEDNIVSRLEIVDSKINIISSQIEFTYSELSSQIAVIDGKLNYVIRQNECTQDFILELFKNDGIDVCKVPVQEFKKRVDFGLIRSYDDLNNFFIAQQCKPCIEKLFSLRNIDINQNNALFRYTDCKTTSETNNNRPDKLYEFIYNNLLNNDQKTKPLDIFSILFIPKDVVLSSTVIDSINAFPDSVKTMIKKSLEGFKLIENDKYYRNYLLVLDLVDYITTMMPFVELYDNGKLIKYEDLISQPNLIKERSKVVIGMLSDLQQLIDRTMFQQSLMTGIGTFKAVDNYIKSGKVSTVFSLSDGSSIALQNLFDYNPYFNKNYSTYFTNKNLNGTNGLKTIFSSSAYKNTGTHLRINNNYKILVTKGKENYPNISVSSLGQNSKKIFESYLPNIKDINKDKILYDQYTILALPKSIPALIEGKKRVDMLLTEMRFVTSDELDKPNYGFSRKDLEILIYLAKQNN